MIDLEPIKERESKATEGPWLTQPAAGVCKGDITIRTKLETGYAIGVIWGSLAEYEESVQDNADFIAHARADIPALVAEIERLRVENENLLAPAMGGQEKKSRDPQYAYAGKLGPWARGGEKGTRYLAVGLQGHYTYHRILSTEKDGKYWRYVLVLLEGDVDKRTHGCGTNTYVRQ